LVSGSKNILSLRSKLLFLSAAFLTIFYDVQPKDRTCEKTLKNQYVKLTSDVSGSGRMPAGGWMAEGRALPAPLVTGSTDLATSLTPPGISRRAL
jgi:hypothetical protein